MSKIYAKSQAWFHRPVEFTTVGGGKLVVAANEFIDFEFTFELLHAGEEVDIMCSLVHLTDADGTVWEGESVWLPSDFLDPAGSFGSMGGIAFASEAEKEVTDSFQSRLLIDGVKDLQDDRFYRYILIGSQLWVVRVKYQSPILDLAAVRQLDRDSVYARISGLRGYPLASADAPLDDHAEEEEIAPFVFRVDDVTPGLFTNFNSEEDEGIWTTSMMPDPVQFTRTELKATPQPLVQFVP